MATGKLLAGEFSVSKSFRDYFDCCFHPSKSRQNSEEEPVVADDNIHSLDEPYNSDKPLKNGSIQSVNSCHKSEKSVKSAKSSKSNKSGKSHKSGKSRKSDKSVIEKKEDEANANDVENKSITGSAYNYDDADTSSDSDDEVLRRYQQSIQRVPSNRSIKSAALSHKSGGKPTKTGKGGDGDRLMSLAEKGGRDGGSSAYSSGADSDLDPAAAAEPGQAEAYSPSRTSKSHHRSHTEYSNGAYAEEEDEEEAFAEGERPSSKSSTEHALSNNGETASMSVGEHDEHLFDVSDLDREPVLISKCGNLEVTFDYDSARSRMKVSVHGASEIPSKERGGANNTQVRLLLLPTKKARHKTKIKTGDNPSFEESFNFKVQPEDVQQMGVRFRLYGCERMRRERMIGESVIGFAMVNVDTPTTHTLALEPRSNLSHGDSKLDVSSLLSRSDSASSTQSMQHGGMPELLIGLAYNGTTGRLSAEVIKGSNFRNMAMNRAPDTYVKLTLMSPNGQEITRSKTSIRRGQPHPLFKETFMFQVALFQLADVTLMVSVYNKRSMKRKEMIGWFSLGYNNSGEEELAHWNDMRESKGEQVCRWHVLLEA